MDGVIFDIKRFSLHDGPGIRTAVFIKGCPLSCIWCQNPEGIARGIRLWHFERKCAACGACLAACPEGALKEGPGGEKNIVIDDGKCTRCGVCVAACPVNALAFDGRRVSSEDVVLEVLKDREFYEATGGGVTLTGGEPLSQPEFGLDVLKGCRERGVHTAIETCLHAEAGTIRSLAGAVDLFIVDLKLFDEEEHGRNTGVGNALIRRNFEALSSEGTEILVRIPLVPGLTAREDNIRAIARYVRETDPRIPIELINYNPLARNKYKNIGLPYGPGEDLEPFTESEIEGFGKILAEEGMKIPENG